MTDKKPETNSKETSAPSLDQTYEFAGEGTDLSNTPAVPPQIPNVPNPFADDRSLEFTIQVDAEKTDHNIEQNRNPPESIATVRIDSTPAPTTDQTVEFETAIPPSSILPEQAKAVVEPTPVVPGAITVDLTGHKTVVQQTLELPSRSSNPTIATNFNPDATLDSKSLLSGADIGMTVNPRDLSEQDQKDWDLSIGSPAAHGGPNFPTQLDRQNISESKLMVPGRNVAGLNANLGMVSDYEIIEVLGEGGMGTVYLARQTSLDRLVALKVVRELAGEQAKRLAATGKLNQAAKSRRDQFLSEAIVTGDLDHPNIVPIHDMAVASDNTLFYAMKKVDGKPWSKVIRQKSQDENIEILLKVCDAIGFAHSRGIVHRDIKPENVMLGDFGVVLLMDWGLAVPKSNYPKRGSIHQSTSLGGSPAYMAPEMAIGPVEKIGPGSDIYLLGATLFQIIVGRPPHGGNNVSECLRAVTTNTFIDVPEQHRNELMQVAMKAMATKISDRYANVAEMQTAIRQYRSHAESIMLAVRAEEDLEQAQVSQDYTLFSRSVFGFEEALKLWEGNQRAAEGLAVTKLAYAEAACQKGDFDLGLSLLDSQDSSHQPTIEKLRKGQIERDSRQKRLVWMKRTAAALLAFILVGGSAALYQIDKSKNEAIGNLALAVENRDLAKRNETEALSQKSKAIENAQIALENERQATQNAEEARQQRMLAENQRMIAEDQKMLAEKNADEALRERKNAEYEAYIAQIGLAKARIDQNEFDDARRILTELKVKASTDRLGWEWQWLWHQANQSAASESLESPATDLSISASGSRLLITNEAGGIEFLNVDAANGLTSRAVGLPNASPANATAISPDESLIASAAQNGTIQVWNAEDRSLLATLTGHGASVTAVSFVDNRVLLSASRDRSVRLWDIDQRKELAACWHLAPVHDLALAQVEQGFRVIAAVADDRMGQAVVWELQSVKDEWTFRALADFLAHSAPVYAVGLSKDGKTAVSGDRDGHVLLWQPDQVPTVDYAKSIKQAVLRTKNVNGKGANSAEGVKLPSEKPVPFQELADRADLGPLRLAVFTNQSSPRAHLDAIEAVRFNKEGTELLSSSADYTMKIWALPSRQLKKTLRGHGGWVRDAEFSPVSRDLILSVSNDATVRVWQPDSIAEPTTIARDSDRRRVAHNDEIWSATFDSTGTRILTASRDHTARVLSLDRKNLTFKPLSLLKSDGNSTLDEGSVFVALSMAMDALHGRLFVGSSDSIVRVWNLDTGGEISQVKGTGINTCLAVAPSGRFLVTGSSTGDAKALVWDVSPEGLVSDKPRWRLATHQAAVTAMAVSPDSRSIFTGDRNGIGILWDATTGKPIGEKLNQHQGTRINAAEFHPTGETLLIAADDQKVSRILLGNREVQPALASDGVVTRISISSDGRIAAAVSELSRVDGIVSSLSLWDLASGKETVVDQLFDTPREKQGQTKNVKRALSPGRILSARFIPGTSNLVVSQTVEQQSIIKLWQIPTSTTAKLQTGFKLPSSIATIVDLIPDANRRLLSLNGDSAFLWDLESRNHIRSYRAHGGVTEASFSSDGKYVLTGSRSVKVWDIESGRSLQKIEFPHEGGVRSVQFTPEIGQYLFASGGDDGMTKLWRWNPETIEFESVRQLKTADTSAVRKVRFSPSATKLLTVCESGVARVWDLTAETPPLEFRDGTLDHAFLCGAFSADEQWIAVGGVDRQARIWSLNTNEANRHQPSVVLQGHADHIEDIGFLGSDASNLRVTTASRDKSARIWDPRLGNPSGIGREILALRRHSLGVTAVSATADGSVLMTASRDGSVILWPAGNSNGAAN